jgi:hypothetical protein
MIRNFDRRQADFLELNAYLQARPDISSAFNNRDRDTLVVWYGGIRQEGGEEVLQQQMNGLGVRRVMRGPSPPEGGSASIIFETAWMIAGLGPSALYKGYAYLPQAPEPHLVHDSFDGLNLRYCTQRCYQPIRDDWYLFVLYVD